MGQGIGAAEPSGHQLPSPQLSRAQEEVLAGQTCPPGQLWQLTEPGVLEKVPAGQGLQLEAPAEEKLPAGQRLALTVERGQKEPAGHSTGTPEAQKKEAGQGTQTSCLK